MKKEFDNHQNYYELPGNYLYQDLVALDWACKVEVQRVVGLLVWISFLKKSQKHLAPVVLPNNTLHTLCTYRNRYVLR